MRVLVIGAGPAGLAAAVKLQDFGHTVEVVEASPWTGGLSRSFLLWGQPVDLGPHRFFAREASVVAFWKRFVGEDFHLVQRLTRIYYQQRYYPYPLEALPTLRNLGPLRTVRALGSYGYARLRPHPDPRSFEEWVCSRFGRYLFSTFFESYTEKLWGIPCSSLDADWAAQRIKTLSLGASIRTALAGDTHRKHRSFVDTFAYPHGGAGQVYQRMAAHLEAGGATLRFRAPVARLRLEAGRAAGVVLESGEEIQADAVVSSMPITRLVQTLPDVPAPILQAASRLRFRNTILVYLHVEHPALFPDNWVYVHERSVLHGRVTNFRNWLPDPRTGGETSILCLEFWCFSEEPLWAETEARLGQRAEAELRQVGLIPPGVGVRERKVLRIPRSYPVYERGYREPLALMQAHLSGLPGLVVIGREGAFKYNNQDHSLLMGMLAAVELHTGRTQGLWEINADDTYQESGEVAALFGTRAGSDSG